MHRKNRSWWWQRTVLPVAFRLRVFISAAGRSKSDLCTTDSPIRRKSAFSHGKGFSGVLYLVYL
jgi:hypothetical protein